MSTAPCTFPALATLVAALAVLVPARAHADAAVVYAVRGTPTIDGRLDDPAWQNAPWTAPFVQRIPQPGAPARHRTRARVLFDDHALYVAIEAETAHRPRAILSRRDDIPLGEWVRIMIDTRGEGVSAYAFTVNPAGVQSDATIQGESDYDAAWDAVWRAETQRSDHGWTAEFAIPWEMLRFDLHHTGFKIQLDRLAFDDGQTVALVPIAYGAPEFVAEFAPLRGIEGIHPRSIHQVQPYLLGRVRAFVDPARLDPTPTLSGSIGADFKLGLSSDLVVDATVNPDFGQVEVDPAVINLTTFETFFPEHRPFFLEGTELFNTPIRLLYTRRMGASIAAPSPLNADGTATAVTQVAPIWGAVKVTGRIGRASFLVLEGVTGPGIVREQYPVQSAPSASQCDQGSSTVQGNVWQINCDRTIVPVTNWLAVRMRGAIAQGSYVGVLATSVERFGLGERSDEVGGLDFDLRAPDGVHRLRGQFAVSHAWNATQGIHDGQALYLEASRAEDPAWVWTLRARVFSRDFDPNGLGYLDRPNLIGLTYDTTFRSRRPMGPLLSFYVNPFVWRTTNMAGLVIDQGTGIETYIQGRNQWSTGLGARVSTDVYDDRETRGGLPYWEAPSMGAWSWISTDPRGPLRGGLYADLATLNGGYKNNLSLSLVWVPTPFVTITGSLALHTVLHVPRWVENLTDAAGNTLSIFGQQHAEIVDSSLRVSAAASRRLTFELFSQLLVGAIRYDSYRLLATPQDLTPYPYMSDASYDRVSFTVNGVARYEYLPGSFATLVLLHRQDLSPTPGTLGYGGGFGTLFDAPPDTMFMLKLTYLYY